MMLRNSFKKDLNVLLSNSFLSQADSEHQHLRLNHNNVYINKVAQVSQENHQFGELWVRKHLPVVIFVKNKQLAWTYT